MSFIHSLLAYFSFLGHFRKKMPRNPSRTSSSTVKQALGKNARLVKDAKKTMAQETETYENLLKVAQKVFDDAVAWGKKYNELKEDAKKLRDSGAIRESAAKEKEAAIAESRAFYFYNEGIKVEKEAERAQRKYGKTLFVEEERYDLGNPEDVAPLEKGMG